MERGESHDIRHPQKESLVGHATEVKVMETWMSPVIGGGGEVMHTIMKFPECRYWKVMHVIVEHSNSK